MNNETILRLLIVENSRNAAQDYIRALRNARLAVRAEIAEDDEDLVELLDKQQFDLLLTIDTAEGLPLGELFKRLASRAPDLPVIVASAAYGTDTLLQALRHGASNVIDRNSAEHLQRVVAREAQVVQHARQLKTLERRLAESEKRCNDLLGSSRDAIAYVHEGMHIYANPSYLELFGYGDQQALEGVPLMDMVALDHQEALKEFLRDFSRGLADSRTQQINGQRPDGSQFPARMEFAPASYDGEPCTQIVIRDDSESLELEQKLNTLSRQDAVTGLYNSIYFVEAFGDWLQQPAADAASAALTYIAIDDFKSVKESVGVATVDRLLRELAGLLGRHAAEHDLLSRFGDRTFTLFAPGTGLEQAAAFAEQLRSTIEETLFEIDKRAVSLTCSFGISPVERGGKNAQAYLAQADMACETAAGKGGNRVHLHNPVSYARASQERDELMIAMIEEAAQLGRFRLHYQPIVSLMGATDENYEVFVRMLDEHGEFVPPGQFIPAAERSGQIAQIERWVIANATHILAKRLKSGKQTSLFINVSGANLADRSLLEWLQSHLAETGLPGSTLVFELGEHAVVEQIGEAREFADSLARLGCRIALDHFGSTPNSFNCLKQIPVHFVKLERGHLTGLKSGGNGLQEVKQVVERVHALDKQVIAEFVESAEMLSTLWQCRIDYIQGYFLQEPSAAMSFDFEGESV
jgi:diguanylate cyclase (GGDEF)-like protein/PAS domain S-box-containing protein